MRFTRANLTILIAATLLSVSAFASNVRQAPTAGTSSHKRTSKATVSHARAASHHIKGQQAIDPERVTQIQQALIREHYLSGDATGNWDSDTIAAMQKFQADQGWQTKLTPDSRALKMLGLGPDYSTAINAREATFTDPPPVTSIPAPQTAGFAAAAGVSQ